MKYRVAGRETDRAAVIDMIDHITGLSLVLVIVREVSSWYKVSLDQKAIFRLDSRHKWTKYPQGVKMAYSPNFPPAIISKCS